MKTAYLISEDLKKEIEQLIRKMRGGVRAGPGIKIKNSPDTLEFSLRSTDDGRVDDAGSRVNQVICVKVTSNAAGNGKYNGKSFTDPTSDVSSSGSLSDADLGTLSSTEDCLVMGLPELGFSNTGHDFTNAANKFSKYVIGRISRINSDNIKVVQAMSYFTGCS